MKTSKIWASAVASLLLSLGVTSAIAKVPAAEAAKLGKELTCVGAEVAANKDGSIPAFSGKWLGTPPGISYTLHVGQHPVDIYPNDKPLYIITAANWRSASRMRIRCWRPTRVAMTAITPSRRMH